MPTAKTDIAYIVVEDFGSLGRAYIETDERLADCETLVQFLLDGQCDRPVRIVAFNPSTHDVSAEIAEMLVERAWSDNVGLPPAVINFCEKHGVEVPEIAYK